MLRASVLALVLLQSVTALPSSERSDIGAYNKVLGDGSVGPLSGYECRFPAVRQLSLMSMTDFVVARWIDAQPERLSGTRSAEIELHVDRSDTPEAAADMLLVKVTRDGKRDDDALRGILRADPTGELIDVGIVQGLPGRLLARPTNAAPLLRADSAELEIFDRRGRSLGRFRWDLTGLRPALGMLDTIDWRCTDHDPR